MPDTATEEADAGGAALTDDVPENEFDRMVGILADGLVGAASGFVGMTLMTGVLLIAEGAGVFSRATFAEVSALVGLEQYFPPLLTGYLIVFGHGMITFPLLYASLKQFLPGGHDVVTGMVFGAFLWTGFAVAFYAGATGLALVGYLALTLVAHLAYGFGVGAVFHYLTSRPDSII
ncbi:MAG: DUF6789 family protein [Halobacteriaceae archaeon]